jgi:kumamolisin
MANVVLPGSHRTAVTGARVQGPAAPTERLQVTVLLRRRDVPALKARVATICSGGTVGFLTPAQFAAQHGTAEADFAAVRTFAATHGLTVVEEHAGRRTTLLSGTVAQFENAFAVKLMNMDCPGAPYRGRVGSVSIPAELEPIVVAVLGLDNRAQAKPHFRIRLPDDAASRQQQRVAPISFTPVEVAALYGFPAGTGAGQCVALIELGGGFRAADLTAYFTALNVGTPQVVAVSVDGASNTPTGDANGPDGEVMLDIEVVGAIAPAARVAVYFAPNTDAGFLDAITTAIHDTTNRPSVISISWGGPESSWTSQAMTAMDDSFQVAATMGITVCVASGDNGSSDGVASGQHVDFPASSPFALACGGTSLRGSALSISSETVWNDGASGGASGGGVSAFFALPAWQAGLTTVTGQGKSVALAMRGIPDIAGDADPQTGYNVRIDGTDTVIGGTSAVAPLWAALVARLNQAAAKPVGQVGPVLYKNAAALRDITQGNNGDYDAAAGWDACTGLGSPNGTALAGVFARIAKGG